MFLQVWARMRNENTELGKPGTILGICKSNRIHHGVQKVRENFCAIVSERVRDQKGSGQPSELLDASLRVFALSLVSTSPSQAVSIPTAPATTLSALRTRVSSVLLELLCTPLFGSSSPQPAPSPPWPPQATRVPGNALYHLRLPSIGQTPAGEFLTLGYITSI